MLKFRNKCFRQVLTCFDKFRQVFTRLERIGQDWTRLYKIGQDWTRLDKFGQVFQILRSITIDTEKMAGQA